MSNLFGTPHFNAEFLKKIATEAEVVHDNTARWLDQTLREITAAFSVITPTLVVQGSTVKVNGVDHLVDIVDVSPTRQEIRLSPLAPGGGHGEVNATAYVTQYTESVKLDADELLEPDASPVTRWLEEGLVRPIARRITADVLDLFRKSVELHSTSTVPCEYDNFKYGLRDAYNHIEKQQQISKTLLMSSAAFHNIEDQLKKVEQAGTKLAEQVSLEGYTARTINGRALHVSSATQSDLFAAQVDGRDCHEVFCLVDEAELGLIMVPRPPILTINQVGYTLTLEYTYTAAPFIANPAGVSRVLFAAPVVQPAAVPAG